MSEWQKVNLGDCCEITSSKRIFFSEYVESGIPFYRSKEIIEKGKGEEISHPLYISKEKYDEIKGKYGVPQKGDLLLTAVGSLGIPFVVKDDSPFYFKDGNLVWLKHFQDIDPIFLYYWIKSENGYNALYNIAIGSAQKALTIAAIKGYEIPLPPLQTQRRIATILSRYDSLMENYQKQIKLLEEAAQRLYKEWFIDLHFPGHENTNILDGVPEGWEKKKLCEFTGITDGTHDSPKQVEIGLPLVTGRCIVDGSIDFSQAYNISEEDVIKINKRSAVEDGDILLSNIGTIGKVCRISKSGNYAVKNMIIFKPHDAIHSCFLHRFLTDNNTQMDFLQQAAGTSQKFVSLSFIRNTLILRPSDTILNLFYNHSEKYFNYVQTLQSQLRLLTEARDRLLPKLMSGEIEI